MRRTFGLVGLALFLVTGAALMAQGFAPTHSPRAHVQTSVPAVPASPSPDGATGGADQSATLVMAANTPVPAFTQLVSPKASAVGLVVWDAPNQNIVGAVASTTWGGPSVRPVVKTQGAWLQVRLDSRPNGSTGWVLRQDVNITTTPYRIAISVSQRTLMLYQNGWAVYAAPVGVGRPQWPTPLGPSFVDAVVSTSARERSIYGPIVLITASHSNVLTDFDGGDGTVGIHGYPSDPASTAGVASSHGCIRASPQTMAAIGQVPPGTPIDIVA